MSDTTWRVDERRNGLGETRYVVTGNTWITYQELKMVYRFRWFAERQARRLNQRELKSQWQDGEDQ